MPIICRIAGDGLPPDGTTLEVPSYGALGDILRSEGWQYVALGEWATTRHAPARRLLSLGSHDRRKLSPAIRCRAVGFGAVEIEDDSGRSLIVRREEFAGPGDWKVVCEAPWEVARDLLVDLGMVDQ